MCKLIKKILCIIIIALILFIGITVWGKGGDKFRWIGDKTGGIIQEGAERFGEKADNLNEKTDAVRKKVKGWTQKEEGKEGKQGNK